MNEKIQVLYNQLSQDGYDVGDINSFSQKMTQPDKARALYDTISKEYELGEFDSFYAKLDPNFRSPEQPKEKAWFGDLTAANIEKERKQDSYIKPGEKLGNLSVNLEPLPEVGVTTESIFGTKKPEYGEKRGSENYAQVANKIISGNMEASAETSISSLKKQVTEAYDELSKKDRVQTPVKSSSIKPFQYLDATDEVVERNLMSARKALDDADKILNSPVDKETGTWFDKAGDRITSWGKGAGERLTNEDFWTMGMSNINRNISALNIAKKLEKGETLRKDEELLLDAFANLQFANMVRADNMSSAYTGGQGIVDMVKFIAELYVSGGVGRLATKGAEKALVKIIAKKVEHKLAQHLATMGTKLLTRSTAAAIGGLIGPSTFEKMSENLLGNTYGEFNGIDLKYTGRADAMTGFDAYIDGWADTATEYATEMSSGSLGVIGKIFKGVPGVEKLLKKVAQTKFGSVWRIIGDNPTLQQFGVHGLLGEYNEVFDGSVVRHLLSLEDFKESFWNWDAQATLLYTLGPVAGFSAGMNGIQGAKIKNDFKNSSKQFDDLLLKNGYSQQEIEDLKIAMLDASPEMLGQQLRSIVGSMDNGVVEIDGKPTFNEDIYGTILQFATDASIYNAYTHGFDSKIEEYRTQAQEFAQKNTNPDMGAIVYARVAGQDVRVTKGNIVFNEDGTLNRENSSKEFYYENEKGEIVPASIEMAEKLLEVTPTAEAADVAEQKLTAPIIAEKENSETRPYNTGDKVTIDIEGSRVMGQIIDKTENGYKFTDSTGMTIDIEPRQIIDEDNLQGVDNGVEVEYMLNGQLQRGVVEDFYQYRQQGQAIVSGNLVNLSDIVGIAETQMSGLTSEQITDKISNIDTALQSGVLSDEQANELLRERQLLESELGIIDNLSEIKPENEGAPASEDNILSENNEVPEQNDILPEETQKPTYPVTKSGEPDFDKFTTQQRYNYTVEKYGLEEGVKDLQAEISEINRRRADLKKKLEKETGAAKLKTREKIAKIEEELKQLSDIQNKFAPELKAKQEEIEKAKREAEEINRKRQEEFQNRQLTPEESTNMHNYLVALIKEHNSTPFGHVRVRNSKRNEINQKARKLGYSTNFIGGQILVFDKEGKEVKAIANRTPKEEIEQHKALSDYSNEMQDFVGIIFKTAPETLYFPNVNLEQAISNIQEGVKSLAANNMLDMLEDYFNKGIVVIKATAVNPEMSISIEEHISMYDQPESEEESNFLNEIPDEVFIKIAKEGITEEFAQITYSDHETEQSIAEQPKIDRQGKEISPDGASQAENVDEEPGEEKVRRTTEVQNVDNFVEENINNPEENISFVGELAPEQKQENNEGSGQDVRINNGDIVFYQGNQYEVNGITTDGQFVDLELDGKPAFEDIPVSEVSKTNDVSGQIESQSPELNPSEAQKEAGNYKKAHVNVQKVDTSIDNPKVSAEENEVIKSAKKVSATVRELADYDAEEQKGYLSGMFFSGLEKGSKFKVARKDYEVTQYSKPKKVEFVGKKGNQITYDEITIRIKELATGKTITTKLIIWPNGNSQFTGVESNQNHEQLSRDIEGDVNTDLINEYNQFHDKSDSFNIIQKALNKLNQELSPIDNLNAILSGEKVVPVQSNDKVEETAEKIKQEQKVQQSAQKEAGNYKKAHITVSGFDITIENPKGSERSGVDENGKKWSITMNNHYGYFKRTEGKDGDQIDVFVGDNTESNKVFVVDQVNPNTGEFDESKVMLGFNSIEEAEAAYLSNYEEGWQGLGAVTEVSVEDFKKWLYDGKKQRKAFSEYKEFEGDVKEKKGYPEQKESSPLKPKGLKRIEFLEGELGKAPNKNDRTDTSGVTGELNIRPIQLKAKEEKNDVSLKRITSKDKERPVMNGIYYDSENKVMVASDGHKMVIIPDKSIKRSQIINPITGAVVEGKYPNYMNAIPVNPNIAVVNDISILIDKLMGIIHANKFTTTQIRPTIKYDGKTIYADPQLLIDVLTTLRNTGTKKVTIELPDKVERAIVFKDGEKKGLVMPLIVEDNIGLTSNILSISKNELKEDEGNKLRVEILKKEIEQLENTPSWEEDYATENMESDPEYYGKELEKARSERLKEIDNLKQRLSNLEHKETDNRFQQGNHLFTSISQERFNEIINLLQKSGLARNIILDKAKMKEYLEKHFKGTRMQGESNLKEKQLNLVLKHNPAPNDYNTWVRSIEDILTASEAFSSEYEDSMYPDFTKEDMQKALESGEVTVYSSKPIKTGVFITPSKMNAEEYSGGGKVYSKVVKLTDVAWIDESEGQYTPVRFLSTSKDEVYGFVTPEGDVYIDTDKLNANTPIHEFTHLWWSIAPNETKTKLIGLFKQTTKWKELENNPAYSNLNTDEKKADELFATWVGNRGEKNVNDLLNEANGDVTLFAQIKNAINEFWQWLKSLFSVEAKIDRIADMTLGELFSGKDISKKNKEVLQERKILLSLNDFLNDKGEINHVQIRQTATSNTGEFSPEDASILNEPELQYGKKLPSTININGVEKPTTNSEGKPIHSTEEGIRNFWEWFGESKVVDEQGRPLVVYHGTGTEFSVFDKKKAQDKEGRKWGVGTGKGVFSFTTDKESAQNWADRAKIRSEYGVISDSPNVISAYLSIKNPISRDQFQSMLLKKAEGYTFLLQKTRDKFISEIYKDLSRSKIDGIISDFGEITAFSPNQIKSATGNTGEFSPEDASILNEPGINYQPRYKVSETGFYSTAEKALSAIAQEKGTKDQFKAMLLKNGAKQAELDWMGWDDQFPDATKKVSKEKQLDIIQSTNPMRDDIHVGIRKLEDIKTFDQVVDDPESFVYGDFSKEDAQKALKEGSVTVYSSTPIKNGAFVSTSEKQAKDYAGNGKVYSQKVNLSDVAWINGDEGQIAKVDNTITKADIQNWIDENRIEVKEVMKGDESEKQKAISDLKELGITLMEFPDGTNFYNEDGEVVEVDEFTSKQKEAAKRFYAAKLDTNNTTKFSQYVLPGGENYKELLLTLPTSVNLKSGIFEKLQKKYNIPEGVPLSEYEDKFTPEEIREWNNQSSNYTKDSFKSSHFDEPNILAHVRFNERTVNGEKVLFIEEIQSDWAQKGKKEGFKNGESRYEIREVGDRFMIWNKETESFERSGLDVEMKFPERIFAEQQLRTLSKNNEGVPSMPFKKTDQWVNLALRRMMRYAAENGFDRIAWTTGEQQAERYDLSKSIDSITYENNNYLTATDKDGSDVIYKYVDPKDLPNVVGKEVAQKLIDARNNQNDAIFELVVQEAVKGGMDKSQAEKDTKHLLEEPLDTDERPTMDEWSRLSKAVGDRLDLNEAFHDHKADNPIVLDNQNLKVGGEGMKAFYDGIVPSAMSKLGKPFGAKIETIEMPEIGEQQSIPVTDLMKQTAMAGLPLYHTGTTMQPTTPEEVLALVQHLFKTGVAKEYRFVDDAEIQAEIEGNEQLQAWGYNQRSTRDRWDNSGYTEREDGTKVSLRAQEAEENGTFTAGTFRKVYGVSTADFNTLLSIGAIVQNEWHHTGKSFKESDYYSWADSYRVNSDPQNYVDYNINGEVTDNKLQGEKTPLAELYKTNKKAITKLSKEFENKQWEYKQQEQKTNVPTFEWFAIENIPYKYWTDYLTEDEKAAKDKRHDYISNELSNSESSYSRKLMHEEVDREYTKLFEERRNTVIEENRKELEQKYNEQYESIISENEAIDKRNAELEQNNKSTTGKESILLAIGEAMGVPTDTLYRKINLLSKNEAEASRAKSAKEKKEIHNKEVRERVAEKEKEIQTWLSENKQNGNITEFSRLSKTPENSIITRSEMNGRHGWFESQSRYNMTEYHSGIAFKDAEMLAEYRQLQAEKRAIEADIQFLRTPTGTIYGFVKNGVVYLNSNTPNLNTPIHEFGHLWIDNIEVNHKALYKKGAELVKETPYWERVNADPNYSHLSENARIKEAMAMAIGDKGEKTVKNLGLFARLKSWIYDVWKAIGAQFGIQNLRPEQIQDLTFNDFVEVAVSELLSGENLTTKIDVTKTPTINVDGIQRPTTNSNGKPIAPTQILLNFTPEEIQDEINKAHGSEENQRNSITKTVEAAISNTLLPDRGSAALREFGNAEQPVEERDKRDNTNSPKGKRTVLEGFKESGYVDFVGTEVSSHQDIADLWSIHRSPYIEKTHVIFIKDGKIAGSMAATSGRINQSMINTPKEIAEHAKKIRATQVYLLHNHPSGLPDVSIPDVYVTFNTANKLRAEGIKLLGHVVVDHDKYSFIDATGEWPADLNTHLQGWADKTPQFEYKNKVPKLYSEREIISSKDAPKQMFEVARNILSEPTYKGAVVYLTNHHKRGYLAIAAYDILPEGATKEDAIRIAQKGLDDNLGSMVVFVHDGSLSGTWGNTPKGTVDVINIAKKDSDNFFNQSSVSEPELEQLWVREGDVEYNPQRELLDAKLNKAQIKFANITVSPSLLREAYQDRHLPVRKFIEQLRETGLNIENFNDWYKQSTHLPGKIDAQLEAFERQFLTPMLGEIDKLIKQGHSYRDVENYAILKHGIERNEWFLMQEEKKYLEKNPQATKEEISEYLSKQPQDYSGITAVQEEVEMSAEDYIKQFEEKSNTDSFWNAVKQATKYSLDKAYEGQIINKDQYNELTNRYKYYIPLRGFDKETAEDRWDYTPDMGTYYVMPLIKAKGRTSRSETPFAFIWQMAQTSINSANKNLHNLSIKRLAELDNKRYASTGLMSISRAWYEKTGEHTWELRSPEYSQDKDTYQKNIEEFEDRMKLLEEQGFATQKKGKLNVGMFIKPKQAAQHEVHVMQNGEEFVVYFNGNPRVARAINGANAIHNQPNQVQQAVRQATRMMAANFTTRNPLFVLSNFLRDYNYASSTLIVKEGVKYEALFQKNIPLIMGALHRAIRGKSDMTNKMDVYAYEYLMNGGRTGYSSIMELNRVQKRVERKIKKHGKENMFDVALEGLKTANEFAENITRLSVYVTSREVGKDIIQSISDAKEVTVNFNRGGSGRLGGNFFKNYYLFFNANIQALANHIKIWKGNPGRMAALTGAYALSGFIAPFLTALIGGDDGEEEYMKLSDWERQTSFCINTGNGFIKIPIAHELRVYHTMGDLAYQWMMGYITSGDAAKKMTLTVSDLIPANPMGATEASWAELSPDLPKPLVQLITNTSFMGTRIYDKYKVEQDIPGFRMVRTNKKGEAFAPEFLIKLAEDTHYITGGDGTKGGLDFNPDKLNHIMRGYFGGLYTMASQAANIASKGISSIDTGEFKLKVRETPLKTFYASSDDLMERNSKLNAGYYDIKKESDQVRKWGKDYIKRAESGEISIDELYKKLNEINYYYYEGGSSVGINDFLKDINKMEDMLKEVSPEEQEYLEMEINRYKKDLINFYQKGSKTSD